jgi:hypothetical protein
MLYNEYEKILTKGKRIDWYDTQVPEKLITDVVKAMANQIVEQINKYEGVDSTQKKEYICNLWLNVKNLPYTMNGDFYLIKKKEIEGSQKKVKPKVESKSTKEPKEETKKVTKNSSLIFGNKTK